MNQDANKNISVWRGEQTPPTDYHLWEKSNGSIFTKVDDKWQQLTSPQDKENTDNSINYIDIGTFDTGITLNYTKNNGESGYRLIKGIEYTNDSHGLMSQSQKKNLNRVSNSICDLGDFNLSSEAESKCADYTIGLNPEVTIMRYTVQGKGPYVVIQSLNELTTTQFLILKGQFYCRDVVYNSNKSINSITPWILCNADGLGWNSSEHKYELWSRGHKMNGGFESIPEGTKNTLGLIDPNKFTIQSTPSTKGLVLDLKYNNQSTSASATIPNDTSIKDVQIATMDSTIDSNGTIKVGTGETALSIVYILSDKTYKLVNISLSKFLEEQEFDSQKGLEVNNHKVGVKIKDGLKFNNNGELTVNISGTSESYLRIGTVDGGLELSGLNVKFNQVDSSISEINKVLYTQHAQVTLSVSPTIIEKGVNKTINLSWKYLYNSQETTPDQLYLVSNGTTLESSKKTYNDTINDTNSYYVVSVNKGITKNSNTITVNAYYPMYFGEGSSTYSSSIIKDSNKRPIASSPNGSVNITFTGKNYLWLCVPNNMTVNKVTSNGFGVPMESPVTQTVNGTYKCYRSTDTINAGTVNFVIS